MRNITGYARPTIERAEQAKRLVRGTAALAEELIDAAQIQAAADRLQTAADELRAYDKRLHGYVAPKREGF